jgi:hypothetical protein
MFQNRIRSNHPFVLAAVAVWMLLSVGGYWWVLADANVPGESQIAPRVWPPHSSLMADPARSNLVLLLHPHCPCSRASLEEFAEIMAECQDSVAAHVLFLKPLQTADGWERTDLWTQAVAIPGVRVSSDEGGIEARRFGAVTSGQVVLFDRQGRMRFNGGITLTRGHRGNNVGRQAVIDWLNCGTAERSDARVFGCPLFSEDDDVRRRPG